MLLFLNLSLLLAGYGSDLVLMTVTWQDLKSTFQSYESGRMGERVEEGEPISL